MSLVFTRSPSQDLRGKILLKAKKIGPLQDSFNGAAEESQTGEVSDENDAAEADEDSLHPDGVRRRVMVGQAPGQTDNQSDSLFRS